MDLSYPVILFECRILTHDEESDGQVSLFEKANYRVF